MGIPRVLYIDHTAEMGGGEIALLNLVRNLDPEKVQPMVLLFAEGPLADRLRPLAETHVLALEPSVLKASKDSLGFGSLFHPGPLCLVLRHVLKVRKFAREHQVGLIHTNSLKADIIGGLAACFTGIPVVWHVRDRIEPDYLPRSVVVLFRILCRWVPDFVIANSHATLNTLHLNGKQRGVAIASGIDTESITNAIHQRLASQQPTSPGTAIAEPQLVAADTPVTRTTITGPQPRLRGDQFMGHSNARHRVLYVDHTAELGGGEIAILNLIRNLDRQRVHPVVLLFSDGPLVERLRPYAETHVLPLEARVAKVTKDSLGTRSLFKIRSMWIAGRHTLRVIKFARHHRIDLIHTASLKADIIGGVAGRLAGIPVVWHVQDRIETDYLPASVVTAFRVLSRILPTFVIANSGATLETLQLKGKREGRAIAYGTAVENLPVHTLEHQNTSSKDTQRPVRIGLIGRISPWKGQHIFIEAASMLHDRVPQAQFEIIGAPLFSERSYEQSLHEQCRRLGMKDAVLFTGFVNDVPARIAELDLVVHASTTGEPFGQVIIEGMAAEKPVVATNGGGVPEIVVDGVTGLLVPMGDAPAMAEAIEWMLVHPDEARQMGRRGRQRVLQHYTLDQMAEKISGVYSEVLAHA